MVEKDNNKNEFSKFFVSTDYIKLKNQLFNYRFRKFMLAKAYARHAKKSEKILDVGCGISPVSPVKSKTVFIDSDKNAMKILNGAGYKTSIGDAEKIPAKKESVNAIFSSEVLEHVHNYKKSIKEFSRVLKKNGVLFITVPTHMKYWAFDDDYVGHLRRFDPRKLANEIENEGFEILENRPIGSFLERELTKLLVKRALNQKPMKISKLKMKGFKLINDFLFGVIYLAYLLNNSENSSIVMIAARKK